MDIARTGITLIVEKFDECVGFYGKLFGLDILFRQRHGECRLACLGFGGAYLMVETGGVARPGRKTPAENAGKPRFNVSSIEDTLQRVRDCGIEAEITRNHRGSAIDLFGPDGKRAGIRDDETFVAQMMA